MLNLLLTTSIAFAITLIAIPAIMRVAAEKKLFDLPDARKLHSKPIASLGGVGIFIGLCLAILLTIPGGAQAGFRFFLASSIVIFFLGLKDDILILSPRKKFLGQLAATAILVHGGGVRFTSMHGVFGVNAVPEAVGLLLSYMTIIVVINAYNLIDGVDGLAGALGILTTTVFGSYFFAAGQDAFALLSFGMAGCLAAFLLFNFQPAKIFMGDSGSLLLGLTNAVLVIHFIKTADAPSMGAPLASAAAIGFSVLILPLVDTLRVFSIRIFRGRSPFSPDRNHIHHLLLDRGLSHRWVTLSCLALNASFIAMAYFGRELGPNTLLAIMVVTAYALVAGLIYLIKPVPRLVVAKSYQFSEPVLQPATKVVSLNNEAAVVEQ